MAEHKHPIFSEFVVSYYAESITMRRDTFFQPDLDTGFTVLILPLSSHYSPGCISQEYNTIRALISLA